MENEIVAEFEIKEPETTNVEFSIGQNQTMEASFEISAGGTKKHDDLENRDLPNQHPISAITGLENALNGKQNALSQEQLSAVNSGITSSKVSTYDGYATSKQDKLNQNQMDAVNSGITAQKVNEYDEYSISKQNVLSETQLSAVNSGITSQKVTNYDNYETTKQNVLSETQQSAVDSGITSTKVGNYDSHLSNTNNPHSVTKTQVGLENVDNTSDLNKPISTATQTALDGKVPTSRTINNKALTSNITLTSSDIGALPNSTKYGASISLSINSSTYVVTAQLKDQDGNNLGNAQTIDLPLESVVVNGAYDNATKKVILTLQNGSTIEFSVADLVDGLQTEITSNNKLSADLVDDTSTTNKFVTSSDITTWNGKQDAISDLSTIRSGASAGATAVQPGDLATVATSGSYADLSNKPYFNGILLNNNSSTSFYATSTSAADATEKAVSIPSITKLETGQIIIVQPTITSTVANSTIKLNSFDAYPMRYNNAAITTSTDSVVWSANYPSLWVFDGTYWVFLAHGLDSNTTYTINYSIDAGQYIAGSGSYAVSRYSLIAQKANGTWEKLTSTSTAYTTGTSKTANTSGFILNQIRYYGTTTNIASGAKIAANTCYQKAASVDLRYSTNCGGTTTWAVGDFMYLVGTIGNDGLFYLDTTTWWTTTLPSTNDGKLYIRLGIVLTAASYTISFFADRPIFYHDGTGIKEYKVADNKQDKLATQTAYTSQGSATKVPQITTNALGQVTGITEVNISYPDQLPSQTGNSGKFLTTNGTTTSWATVSGGGGGTVTSVRVQATSPVQSSTSTEQTTSLNTTISLADGYGDTKNPYASKTKNYVLAAPNGSNGAPSFRALVKADIPLASETAASGGTTTSLVTTGEKYTWNNKQDALVSGTNIKTINNQSILGSGNINIQGGGKFLVFTSVFVDATHWTYDGTYADYPYAAEIYCEDVTSSDFAYVVFAPEDFDSGIYANVCLTGTDSVTIYAKSDVYEPDYQGVTIPTIVVIGA